MEINGKTVLVTRASSGMGAAIAKEMVLAGARELLLLARNENDLKEVAAEIAAFVARLCRAFEVAGGVHRRERRRPRGSVTEAAAEEELA